MTERGVVSTNRARLTARLGRDTGFREGGGGEEEMASGSDSDTSTGEGVRECFQQRRRLRGGEAACMAMDRQCCLREGECRLREGQTVVSVTNFIQPYLHQFFIDSHGLNGYKKPLKRPFYRYQSRLEAISIGRDIRQINW